MSVQPVVGAELPPGYIGLWSLRHSVAWGWGWRLERTCLQSSADEWLRAFRKDEPEVTFVVAQRAPRTPRGLLPPKVTR